MSEVTEKEELLDDAIALCHRIKGERRLWNGDVGLTQPRREDINDLIARYNELKASGSCN